MRKTSEIASVKNISAQSENCQKQKMSEILTVRNFKCQKYCVRNCKSHKRKVVSTKSKTGKVPETESFKNRSVRKLNFPFMILYACSCDFWFLTFSVSDSFRFMTHSSSDTFRF